ncbi:hypothetical protein E5335_02090 [Coriobacteriaceae bacterium]|nr:hypothetical protein E5335_02090 [Coriobacteriaceae bacterium]
MLGHDEIVKLMGAGVVSGATEENVGQVSVDTTTKGFYGQDGELRERCTLSPGDSVMVAAVECIDLPDDVACRVILRNSRIREGLTLDAPLYFPTHKTRVFFRVTNVSANSIGLDTSNGIAALTFERVDGGIGSPYRGAFVDELSYRDLASYTDVYAGDVTKAERAADRAENVEKRAYSVVMTLMAVFVSVFTLVNVNLMSAFGGADPGTIVVMNLSAVGCLLAMFSVITVVLKHMGASMSGSSLPTLLVAASAAAFVAAVAVAFV